MMFICTDSISFKNHKMKNLILSLLVIFNIARVSASSFEVDSKVESVVLYHSGAMVKRVSTVNLPVGVTELIFRNISKKLLLNSLKVGNRNITILNKQIIKKISNEEFKSLFDQKDAIQKQINLIEEKYTEVGFVKNVEDLEKLTLFYSSIIIKLKSDLRKVDLDIKIAKTIENIELDNENAAILKLIVSVQKKSNVQLSFEYVCGGIGWSPYYEIAVESASNKSIKIKYLARTMSQTGENWDDVSIFLSSSFPLSLPTQLPVVENIWELTGRGSLYNLGRKENDNTAQIEKLKGVKYQEINVPSNLSVVKIKGRNSIKSNSTVFTFLIKNIVLPADYYYYGFPNMDPDVYLVAELTNWDTLGFLDGLADISFGGNNIGKTIIKFSESKNKLTLPIGKDNSVFMKRTEIADQKYFKLSRSSKKKTTTLAYQYELKNNNQFPIQFKLVDQVPISQTKKASVDIVEFSNGLISQKTGEVIWKLNVSAGEEVRKKLIFTIEMESQYRYIPLGKLQIFKPVSCPAF